MRMCNDLLASAHPRPRRLSACARRAVPPGGARKTRDGAPTGALRSLKPDARAADDVRPLRALLGNPPSEFRGRIADQTRAQVAEALLHLGVLQRRRRIDR